MKKTLFLCLSVIMLCACSSKGWEDKVGVSDLKIENHEIVGTIQNKTDKVLDAKLSLIGKNGSLEVEKTCSITIDPESLKDLKCRASQFEDNYEVVLKDLDFTEHPIFIERKFQDGDTLTVDDFHIYFNGAMESCSNFHSSIFRDAGDIEYPYIEKCIYNKEKETAKVTNTGSFGKTTLFSSSDWNRYLGRLESCVIQISKNDDTDEHFMEVVDDVRFSFLLDYISESTKLYHTKIYEALKKHVEYGYGYEYGDYIYGYTESLDDNGKITNVTFKVYKSK